jgi:diguanylate cyclase (GGDEF)-like protein
MTNGSTKAMVEKLRRRLVGLDGAIALVGILALIIGFFVDSRAGWVICGLVFASAAAYLVVVWRQQQSTEPEEGHFQNKEEAYSQSPEGDMKKLLFDDFQSSEGGYVVKEVEDNQPIVPSTKQALPAPLPQSSETVRELEVVDFFDLDSDSSIAEAEPRAEFHSLMNKVLIVLKEVLFSHTVAFFWVNREKQQMVPEGWATSSESYSKTRFPLGDDLVSRVATGQKPQLVGRLDAGAELEMLRYYSVPNGVRSVVGVPIFFKRGAADVEVIGVVVADSLAEDCFGQETLMMLGQFTKLISSLVKSYTDKYDLLLEAELANSLRRMQDKIKSDPREEIVFAALAEESNRLARWDYMTITMYSEAEHGWVVQKAVNKLGMPYVAPGQVVDLRASIVADAIRTNEVQNVPDLTVVGLPRFADGERVDTSGSFLCIPISSFNRCYGAFTVESKDPGVYSGNEEGTLYRLVENAAGALEVLYMNDLVREYVVVDHRTGSMTRRHFLKRMEDEVRRAEEFATDLSLVSFAVDGLGDQVARYGKDSADAILTEITKVIRANIRTFDAVGRHETDRLGVLLVNMPASDAYLWAEKVRKLVAGHVINLGAKAFSVTVSVGVCGLADKMPAQQLLSGTSRVLEKAQEGGGNLVRVY